MPGVGRQPGDGQLDRLRGGHHHRGLGLRRFREIRTPGAAGLIHPVASRQFGILAVWDQGIYFCRRVSI